MSTCCHSFLSRKEQPHSMWKKGFPVTASSALPLSLCRWSHHAITLKNRQLHLIVLLVHKRMVGEQSVPTHGAEADAVIFIL